MSEKTFDREAFKKEIEQWLSSRNTFEEKRPFYRYLAVITLINLSRLTDKDLELVWKITPLNTVMLFIVYFTLPQ